MYHRIHKDQVLSHLPRAARIIRQNNIAADTMLIVDPNYFSIISDKLDNKTREKISVLSIVGKFW